MSNKFARNVQTFKTYEKKFVKLAISVIRADRGSLPAFIKGQNFGNVKRGTYKQTYRRLLSSFLYCMFHHLGKEIQNLTRISSHMKGLKYRTHEGKEYWKHTEKSRQTDFTLKRFHACVSIKICLYVTNPSGKSQKQSFTMLNLEVTVLFTNELTRNN